MAPPAEQRPSSLIDVIKFGEKFLWTDAQCEKFFYHYQARGWMGIRDWQAAMESWYAGDKAREKTIATNEDHKKDF